LKAHPKTAKSYIPCGLQPDFHFEAISCFHVVLFAPLFHQLKNGVGDRISHNRRRQAVGRLPPLSVENSGEAL
jgi:hypothetical protein